jgi:Phosphoenolpyruvate synthase/pyruvate phosphate dikinase
MNSCNDASEKANGNELTLPFTAIDKTLLPLVGGKAANLGEMTGAGFPVPPGFCITTNAYTLMVSPLKLTPLLDELSSLSASETQRRQTLAAELRAQLATAPIPDTIAAAITQGYQQLAENPRPVLPVAVRSSATAEDLPFASFAGQQDTYLNIVGTEALLDAVRRCWASLWTDRAVSYRATNAIDQRNVRLAVIVQQMVDARVAGILFTANPLTGKRQQAVIDASEGLGEAVVSGAVNPDHFVVQTATGEIVERHISAKQMLIRAVTGGGTEQVILDTPQQQASLDDTTIRALAKLGQRVEDHYQAPQDTEWALDGQGKLWLTQARPITTLYPLPPKRSANDDTVRVFLSFNVAQGVFAPFTPMGNSTLRLFFAAIATAFGNPPEQPAELPFMPEAGLRLFMDLTTPFRNKLLRPVIIGAMGIAEARSQPILERLRTDPRFALTQRSRLSTVRIIARALLRTGIPGRIVKALLRPTRAAQVRARIFSDLAAISQIPDDMTPDQRLAAIDKLYASLPEYLFQIAPMLAGGMLSLLLSHKLLKGIASPDEIQITMRSVPLNVTTEMDLTLWALAQKIQQDPASLTAISSASPAQLVQQYHTRTLPATLTHALDNFLRVYGHRGIAEIDLGHTRWSENPEPIFATLLSYLHHTQPELVPNIQFASGAHAAEAMIKTLTQRACKKNWLRGKAASFTLGRLRALIGMRELPKFVLVKIIAVIRAHLKYIGQELVVQQCLANEEDIFFLYQPEIRAALNGQDFRAQVRARRATYDFECKRKHIPRILLSDGTVPEVMMPHPNEQGAMALQGTAASPGHITGRARVILDPAEAYLEQGEILVAPSTDPGWTPLFLTAGALVMEMGGPMSHGAVVAREYGIPAVVGVPRATEQITTGQMITVDGASGIVTIEHAPATAETKA